MAKLTPLQRQKIREYLEQQGLSFKPLQEEMIDHLGCDLELRMSEGYSFDKAWHQVMGEIGENQFQIIQHEIMETINKRFTWSQGLSFVALGLLFISMLFKVLHLQYGGVLLILSFLFIAASLLTTSVSGVFLNRDKQGAVRVLSMVAGIIVLLIGYAFIIFHMPGADQLLLAGVGVLIISLVMNTIHVYNNSSGHENLLTYLHEKYTPGIERFFLILLFPLFVYKSVLIGTGAGGDTFAGGLILLVVMFGSGLQFVLMCWRTMENNLDKRSLLTLAATIMSSVCLALPFLGPLLPIEVRVVAIVLFSAVSGWLAYTMEEEPRGVTSLIMACLVSLVFAGWALIRLNLLGPSSHSVFFNLPVMIILAAGLLLCRKHGIMRAYMLISLSSYMFEYII